MPKIIKFWLKTICNSKKQHLSQGSYGILHKFHMKCEWNLTVLHLFFYLLLLFIYSVYFLLKFWLFQYFWYYSFQLFGVWSFSWVILFSRPDFVITNEYKHHSFYVFANIFWLPFLSLQLDWFMIITLLKFKFSLLNLSL